MQVTVVGAGIGGLGAALALARSGHDVNVLEKASALEEVGAGIQLGANGCRVLQHWELLQALADKAEAAPFGYLGDGLTGKPLCNFPLSRFSESHYRLPHLQIHRADLLEVLLDACNLQKNIRIFTQSSVVQIQQQTGKVICFTDRGDEYESELLIGADGMRSRVAELVFARPPAKFSGKVAWRALVKMDQIDTDLDTAVPGIWMAPGKHLVHYPIRGGRLLNIVACANSSARVLASWDNACSTEEFLQIFGNLAAKLQAIITPLEESYAWGLYETGEHSWVKDRVVLLGDAAHAMLPSMAQGATMALEDAAVLEQLLAGGKELSQVLEQYQRIRTHRVKAVLRTARKNIDLFHRPRGVKRTIQCQGLAILGKRTEAILGRRYDWIYGYDLYSEAVKAVR